MTRWRKMAKLTPPQRKTAPASLTVPTHWTPEQASAVFEVLDDLLELIWQRYGQQIQQVLRDDQLHVTPLNPVSIDDKDVPF